MPDDTPGKVSAGWLDGLYRWFKGGPPPQPSPAGASDDAAEHLPSRIGHYAIRRKLGAGGMGVVYEADDERLKRRVALKMMLSLSQDDLGRRRFWREARAAASVNHPHVCQIYEVGEENGALFIAMRVDANAVASRRRFDRLVILEGEARVSLD